MIKHLLLATAVLTVPLRAQDAAPDTAAWQPLLEAGLTTWELWMGAPHVSVQGLPEGTVTSEDVHKGTPLGLGNDPKHVFSVRMEEGEPVLYITGEIFGGLTTLESYRNYHFRAQFKWGEKKWEPKLKAPRDNGILIHCTGPHGSFWNVWKSSIEFQVEEKGMADLYTLAGTSAFLPATKGAKKWSYDPAGEMKPFGRIADAVGGSSLRLIGNFEKPNGEWNTLEIYAMDRSAWFLVNGTVVNVLTDMGISQKGAPEPAPLSSGQIQLQSEGAEASYRRVEIQKITEIPAALTPRQ